MVSGVVNKHKRESSVGDTSRAGARVTSAQAWLTSSQLQSHLISAVSELQSALNKMNEAEGGDSRRDEHGRIFAKRGTKVTRTRSNTFIRVIFISSLKENVQEK